MKTSTKPVPHLVWAIALRELLLRAECDGMYIPQWAHAFASSLRRRMSSA